MRERAGFANVDGHSIAEAQIERIYHDRLAVLRAEPRDGRAQARVRVWSSDASGHSVPATVARITARSRRARNANSRWEPPASAGSASPPTKNSKVPRTETLNMARPESIAAGPSRSPL